MLTGMFFLVGMSNSGAQELARGFDNPHQAIADGFDVTAYDLGTFNREEAIVILEGIVTPLKPLIGHGATQTQTLKYHYATAVLNDVQSYSIAVEIALLKRLNELNPSSKQVGQNSDTQVGPHTTVPVNPPSVYANLYNEIVNELQ